MKCKTEERLKEIIQIASKLNWIVSKGEYPTISYDLMQLSEVEKCMLAMVDDLELQRMREWKKEASRGSKGE